MEISGFPGGGVHVSKGGCTCKQKGCTGRCSLLLEGVNVANRDRVDVCPCSSSCMDEINNHVM